MTKTPFNYLQPFWRWVAAFVLAILLIWLGGFLLGCTGTVVPKPVTSSSVAYEGNEQNAGVLKVWPGKGALLTERKKTEYDALVGLYGHGTKGHQLIPPVKKGEGLTMLRGRDEGFPLYDRVWHIDAEALTNFLLFKDWQRAGREPF